MNIFDSLQKYAGNWSVVGTRVFNAEEIAAVDHAEVVSSNFGSSVCFFFKSGGQSYIPLSTQSSLGVGDTVDLGKARLVTAQLQQRGHTERDG